MTGVTLHGVVSPAPPSPVETLHPTPYALHPTPCTLHPTPYTLHPTPHTLHPPPGWSGVQREGFFFFSSLLLSSLELSDALSL